MFALHYLICLMNKSCIFSITQLNIHSAFSGERRAVVQGIHIHAISGIPIPGTMPDSA